MPKKKKYKKLDYFKREIDDNAFEFLGVNNMSTSNDIKKAYRKLALIWHPDKCPPDSDQSIYTDKFQKLFNFYEEINTDEKKEYIITTYQIEVLMITVHRKSFSNYYSIAYRRIGYLPVIVTVISLMILLR